MQPVFLYLAVSKTSLPGFTEGVRLPAVPRKTGLYTAEEENFPDKYHVQWEPRQWVSVIFLSCKADVDL